MSKPRRKRTKRSAAATETPEAFFERHAAGGPTHVVAVMAMRRDGGQQLGLFSSLKAATTWSDGLSDEEFTNCIFSPYVIDVPEFGNVPRNQKH